MGMHVVGGGGEGSNSCMNPHATLSLGPDPACKETYGPDKAWGFK